MLSLKDVAATKVAISICNNSQLKKEILCVFGSEYDVKVKSKKFDRKTLWNEIIDKKARLILKNHGLTKNLQEKVIGIVLSVGMRILIWAEYNQKTLGFSHNQSFNFLDSSIFTIHGIVDCKKAAAVLMNDKSLNIKQKYKLALLYCMNEHIPALYNQMREKDKFEFYDSENPSNIKQPHFVKFWSYYLMDEVDKLRGDTDPYLYWLEMAVRSGNKDVVEYCLKQTNLITDDGALIYAALKAVKNKVKGMNNCIIFSNDWRHYDKEHDDLGAADIEDDGMEAHDAEDDGMEEDNDMEEDDYVEEEDAMEENDDMEDYDSGDDDLGDPWLPSDYYTDVMCFLLSKMREDIQKEFLKEEIRRDDYQFNSLGYPQRLRVLECFLDWPYQDHFLKTVKLMWDFLPETSYFFILEKFTHKITTDIASLTYGEEINYDYKKLLLEFLKEIPEPNQKYIFKVYEFDNEDGGTEKKIAGSMLLLHLFTQASFSNQDKLIVEWIFYNATKEEKENMILSELGFFTCIVLMELERWKLLDDFVSSCCTSKEDEQKIKKMFIFEKEAYDVCIDFLAVDNWNAVESFIRWCDLSDMELNQLKEIMIYSDYGRKACARMISADKIPLATVYKVINWCLPTENVCTYLLQQH